VTVPVVVQAKDGRRPARSATAICVVEEEAFAGEHVRARPAAGETAALELVPGLRYRVSAPGCTPQVVRVEKVPEPVRLEERE